MITKNDIVKLIKKKIPGYTVTENASLRNILYDLLTYVEDAGNTKVTLSSIVPTSSTTVGTLGDVTFDGEYMYYCAVTGTEGNAVWVRTAMGTWV